MSNALYKATLRKSIALTEVEELIASNDGIILRVDQKKRGTVVFFASDEKSAKKAQKSFARYGKVVVRPSTEKALLKLP